MYYIILVLLTLIQTIVFVQMTGMSMFIAQAYIIRLLCNYTAAAMVLWLPLLFTPKRRWTYIVTILLDVWFVGNLIYFNSYGDVLNRWCLLNISNMRGIWDSILPYLQIRYLIFPCISILWIVLSEIVLVQFRQPLWKRITVACIGLCIVCVPQTAIAPKNELPISPFAKYYADVSMGRIWYMHTFGPITHLANETVQLIRNTEEQPSTITPEEIAPFIQTPDLSGEKGNLLFIFFESLEERIIGLRVNGREVTPNINRLVAHSKTGHYAITAQVKEGKSSDAQLIAFNGLLPIANGATAMRYAGNTYPSLVRYSHATTKQLYAAYPDYMWNQRMNALAYGFDSLYACEMSDLKLMQMVSHAINNATRPFILTAVTMASHSPFTAYADSTGWQVTDNRYTHSEAKYLQCVHYTDNAIGKLIDAILIDSILAATTQIVITGDHPIFDLNEPVPFIIYNPFASPVTTNKPHFQTDIYTTLIENMHIATPWHGLGKNISDTTSYPPMEMLYNLSDRIIRSDYFSTRAHSCIQVMQTTQPE